MSNDSHLRKVCKATLITDYKSDMCNPNVSIYFHNKYLRKIYYQITISS